MIEIQLTSIKDILLIFSWFIAIFLLGILIGKGIYEVYIRTKEEKAEKKLQEAEEKANKILEDAQNKVLQQLKYLEKLEENILLKEKTLSEKQKELEKQKQKIETLKEQQLKKLENIAKLSYEEAKKILFEKIEKEYENDILQTIQKLKKIKESKIKEESINLITKILPRVATTDTSELNVTTISIPDESFKGRLIGKEGRNIKFFEKLTGVELIIDDTPGIIRLSSFDPEKRFIAENTIKMLIQDGRINPIYMQQFYDKAKLLLDEFLENKGQEALDILNISYLHPDIVKMIGKFYLRYSYGQNLWIHSIEVAQISQLLANELGLDGDLAKKAGLLHDIGKVIVGNLQSHSKVGADFLRKYNLDPIIINAAEGHHMEVELIHPISYIVTAADAISASRPGARFNNSEFFLERMKKLENLILSIPKVEKVHIFQAGREIRVFANPQEITSDLELEKLNKEISDKLKEHIDYPGMVKIVSIRENKIVSYL